MANTLNIVNFIGYRFVRPGDLNSQKTLFGGNLFSWIDETAALFVITTLKTRSIATRAVKEILFEKQVKEGDLLEIIVTPVKIGKTSFTVSVCVKNWETRDVVANVKEMTFVVLDENGKPVSIIFSLQNKVY